jgi:diaminopimelate decarboxylase
LCKSNFEEVLRLVLDNDNMSFAGIHYYSGTQKKMSKIEKELSMLNEYAHYIKETYDVEYIELEYGPSMLVSYFEEENIDSKEMQLSKLNAILQEVNNYDKITLEYGRFLAANCGYYITKINDIKKTEKTNYIIVDGGIHHVNYYGQMMGMKKPYMKVVLNSVKNERKNISVKDDEDNEIKEKWTICGSLCTVNDIIVREKNIDNPKINDIIVFENTGAYSAMEGMNLFLSRSLPSVYLYKKDKTLCKVRDAIETYTFNDVL